MGCIAAGCYANYMKLYASSNEYLFWNAAAISDSKISATKLVNILIICLIITLALLGLMASDYG